MKEKFRTRFKNALKKATAPAIFWAGLCLVGGAIGYYGTRTPREPINTSPEISEKKMVFTRDQGTGIQFNVEENGRVILFYDHGYDGTLDEVGIHRFRGIEYETHDFQELKKWQQEYERIRKERTGEFQSIYLRDR